MPIQPLDLQTLFAQINQVGKEQAILKDGLTLQQAAHAAELIKETKHSDESVNKTKKSEEDSQRIQEDEGEGPSGEHTSKKDKEKSEEKKKRLNIFTDPDLGKNIDISG